MSPVAVRRPGRLTTRPIPLNAYATPLAIERERIGDANLTRMLRDMLLIREFESMLADFKRSGTYRGIAYEHAGPAHLSIGQEAVAVGQAFALDVDDHIFGSHRSHGEILAKGLSAIAQANDAFIAETLTRYLDGEILAVLDAHLPPADWPTRAVQYLLYGLAAEIFGRRTGFNHGLGGSMHAFFPPFGIYPNNAIVGGSAGIAAGAALSKKVQRRPGIVVANIGDGSSACGPVWEAINFAAMAQFRTLWEEDDRGGLPVVFCFVDNFYAMGGQPIGETAAFDRLARIGAAFGSACLHAETVDGNDALAVLDAFRRKRALLEAGEGPVLLDVQCYRQSGHSPSDAGSYRSAEEVDAWRAVDPIREFGDRLEGEGVLDPRTRGELACWAADRVLEATRLATDLCVSPRLDLGADPDSIGRLIFSNVERDLSMPSGGPLVDLERSSRVQQLRTRARWGRDERGERLSGARAVTVRDALFEAIADAFARDETLVAYGEENRDWGGAFGVYRGLTEVLPYRRLFNAPISEAAIVGSAVGYALEGGTVLVELMYADFMGRAGDELFNQLAKWQAMSGGVLRMPVVVRVSVGSKYGAQHAQDWGSLVAHIPGLKVVYPATPYDAKGLMASALAGSDPVVFFESQQLYDTVELFHPGGVPRESYRLPIGVSDVKRAGDDLTILTIGPTLYRALVAADRLSSEFGLEAEVIDARSLVPFNYEPLLASVRKTGRVLLTSDACERGSYLHTLASTIQQLAFDDLDAPAVVVGARDWITPPAEMERFFFPQPEQLLEAVDRYLVRLPGYRSDSAAAP